MAEEKKEVVTETLQTSMIRMDKTSKLARLAGAFALRLARQSKDPLFEKYLKIRKMYLMVKQQLMKKYGMKGKALARKAALK